MLNPESMAGRSGARVDQEEFRPGEVPTCRSSWPVGKAALSNTLLGPGVGVSNALRLDTVGALADVFTERSIGGAEAG